MVDDARIGASPDDILRSLIGIRSQNGVDDELAVARYIAEFFRDLGLLVTVREVQPKRPNVVAVLHAGPGPTLTFNSHLDTVAAGDGWTSDPFVAVEREGALRGRGAVDAKGPLAAILSAVADLVDAPLDGTIVVTAVVDEEAGSLGARELVREFQPDFAIVGEPTNLDIGIAHRGSIRPVIAVQGRAAHSSVPEQGDNAIYRALPVLTALEAYATNLTGTHALCGSPSAAITMLRAGLGPNVIPDRCEIVLDRRMIPGEVEAEVRAGLEGLLVELTKRQPGLRASIDRWLPTTGGSSEIDPADPFVATVRRSVRDAGGRGDLIGMTGACDMTHFRAIGVPTVVVGPGDAALAHEPDEEIAVTDLRTAARAYRECALSVCRAQA